MTDHIDEAMVKSREKMGERQRLIALRKALSTSIGYMTNALIDLQTNTPKRTAIMTIEGGLKLAREALEREDMQEAITATDSEGV
jgi:hypothetical protein